MGGSRVQIKQKQEEGGIEVGSKFTNKEIVAFTEGKLLDDMETQQEIGKRPYQKVLLVLGSAVLGFIVCYLMGKIFLR